MSKYESNKTNQPEKPHEQGDNNPDADIFSDQFKVTKYTSLPPRILSQTKSRFDNFELLSSVIQDLNGSCTKAIFISKARKLKNSEPKASSLVDIEPSYNRKFLPHQQLVTKPKKTKFTRNILSRFDNGYKGPIGFLKRFMDLKIKVKILIRKEHGVKGTITGQIEAFDKHWNIVMSNAVEIWTRRKWKYSTQKTVFKDSLPEQSALKRLAKMGLKLPLIAVKSLDQKHVKCTRQLSQIMIRGEQIVFVAREEC